jgi:class 3 adenylate cyclase
MDKVRVERRLAAIMAADIVGYSRLVEADEAATFTAIKALRADVIDPLLIEHNGRMAKLMGDGAIVEFGSVVDAVACAVAIQKEVAARQAESPAERRVVFRIGINLGDVVVEDGDLLGDGVNVAARLEQLCEPGGVLVSGSAYDQMQGKLGPPLDFIGEQQVKNISRPVRAYRVRMDGVRRRATWNVRRLRRMIPIAAVLILVVLLAGAAAWWLRPATTAAAEPAIAVLPFQNMSGDPAQDYFGQGVAEDIITMLATFPTIRVVSRMSSFVYDKPGARAAGGGGARRRLRA